MTGTSAAKEVQTRPINTAPSSEATFTMVQGWLQTCLSSHMTCRDCVKSDLAFMPTRLIEITRPNYRLYETAGRPVEPYAALSYCWGTTGQLTSTRSTYQSHLAGIDPQALPGLSFSSLTISSNDTRNPNAGELPTPNSCSNAVLGPR